MNAVMSSGIRYNERNKAYKIALFVMLIGYLLLNGILLYCHEPWEDEAQAWLIARDVPFFKIPRQMAIEGHPCLWYWILAPFAKLEFPYITINIISFIIMTVAVTGFLFASRLPLIIKLLVVFSPVCTYYYPVISRSYCLIPPLLFLSAIFFKTRKDRPVRYMLAVALLVQTHALMIIAAFFICVCFLVEVLYDCKKSDDLAGIRQYAVALLLPVVSVVLFGFQMIGVEQSAAYNVQMSEIGELLNAVIHRLWYNAKSTYREEGFIAPLVLLFLFIVTGYVCLCQRIREAWTAFVVVGCTAVGHAFFYVMVYAGLTDQKRLLIPLLMAWGAWILEDQIVNLFVRGMFGIYCVLQIMMIVHLAPSVMWDVQRFYSCSRETGEWLSVNVPGDSVLISDYKPFGSAVLPYLKQRYYIYAASGEEFSYNEIVDGWNDTIGCDDFLAWVEQLDAGAREVWLISAQHGMSCIENAEKLDESYQAQFVSSEESSTKEDYVIYRLR